MKGPVTVVMLLSALYLCTFFTPAAFILSLFVFLPRPRLFPSTDLIR